MLENEPTSKTTLSDSVQATNFWHFPTLDELAKAQGVSPITDIEVLFGTWPGDPDDGFEALIVELRYREETRG